MSYGPVYVSSTLQKPAQQAWHVFSFSRLSFPLYVATVYHITSHFAARNPPQVKYPSSLVYIITISFFFGLIFRNDYQLCSRTSGVKLQTRRITQGIFITRRPVLLCTLGLLLFEEVS